MPYKQRSHQAPISRRRRTADDTAAVEAGLAPTEVVHKDEHYIRFVLSVTGRKARQQRTGEQNFDGRCSHFHIIVLFFSYSSSILVVEQFTPIRPFAHLVQGVGIDVAVSSAKLPAAAQRTVGRHQRIHDTSASVGQ